MWYNILKIKRFEVYYIKEVFRGVKVKLYPTKEQIEYFELCVKARNFAYNWGLEIWRKHYDKTKSNIGMYSLNNMFNEYKKLEENKWLYLVCSKVCSLAFKDLESAYYKYFKGLKNKPIFKNDKSKKSFPVRLDNITITDKYIKISKKKYIKYKKIKNIKNTYLHKITKEIVDLKPKKIVVERFETLRLYKQFRYKRSKEFSKRLMELNFYTLQRYLKYKCENNGIEYIEVDKNYSATQRCSNCGNVKVGDNKLSINHRVYKCDKCGLEMDRDLNASINLKKYTT